MVAVVAKLEASDPILSSVSAHPPIQSKLIIFGRYLAFCSYDPRASTVNPSKPACTITKVANPGSTLAIYAVRTPWRSPDVPAP